MKTESVHYHITGIAGTGMSALAQAMTACGLKVTGSDRYIDQGRTDLPVLRKLGAAGIPFYPQDGSALDESTAGIVISTAVEDTNPEIQRAREMDIPVIHRASMLAQLIGDNSLITIAGTSGKTTVTGITGWLLEQTGYNPFVVNGGSVPAWSSPSATGSVRPSQKPFWVIEADESDRSFLRFHPTHTIITNISQDHFELDESIALFQAFSGQVKQQIICPQEVASLLTNIPDKQITVMPTETVTRDAQGWFFILDGYTCRVPQPGRHNALNALAATILCRHLGADTEILQQALLRFPGLERRLEYCGGREDVTVYDDYAHNPEKIRAAWNTIKELHPRIIGIWKPHGFKPLSSMADILNKTFYEIVRDNDRLFIPPVYYAGGTTSKEITSPEFCEMLQRDNIAAEYTADYTSLLTRIPEMITPGTAVLCMGARDPELPLFAHNLAKILSA